MGEMAHAKQRDEGRGRGSSQIHALPRLQHWSAVTPPAGNSVHVRSKRSLRGTGAVSPLADAQGRDILTRRRGHHRPSLREPSSNGGIWLGTPLRVGANGANLPLGLACSAHQKRAAHLPVFPRTLLTGGFVFSGGSPPPCPLGRREPAVPIGVGRVRHRPRSRVAVDHRRAGATVFR